MLKDLIANQKVLFSKNLYFAGHIETIFNDLKSKGDLVTAILMLEEKEQSLLLFILQDDLYAAVQLNENTFSALPFTDYFTKMSQAQGAIHLYVTNPIFFKALLVLAQKKPNIVATTDILNIEALLNQVQKKKKEAILLLKKKDEMNLFYFRAGKLSEGYFQVPERMAKEGSLQEQLLVYTYSSDEADPMEIQLFYDLDVSPAADVDDALEALGEGVERQLASRPRLILRQEGTEELIEKVLNKGIFTLGRDLRSDWAIKDQMVSREHAIIKEDQDGFFIEDRGSRNGTFVNKEKILRKKLSDRDEIRIGSASFFFSEKEEQAPPQDTSDEMVEEVLSEPAAEERGTWSLEFLSGKEVGRFLELSPKRLSIGRGKTDVVVNDPKVSRHHADLEWSEKGFFLVDLKSTNGIFVNDQKIDKKLLSAEDVITVGDTRLRVVCKK
ncbi:MAG: FHA domain-containing protein [Candidatus Manganitrophaceae bacterium]|nr:MAG: FHA domain-containing protein [Candidatus Manganitrophaceae bacterium]